jgi:hypothetical protein
LDRTKWHFSANLAEFLNRHIGLPRRCVSTAAVIENKLGIPNLNKHLLRSFLAFLSFTVAGCSPGMNGASEFQKHPVDLASFGLFDLGVAEINNDTFLDVYTSNHSGPQSVLINQNGEKFSEQFSKLNLDQDRAFPGLAVVPKPPVLDKSGVYIYWLGPKLYVNPYGLKNASPVTGTVSLLSTVRLTDSENADVRVNEQPNSTGITHTEISFTIENDGFFSFKPVLHALPISFRLDVDVQHVKIFVGPKLVAPTTPKFTVNMRDRHGMAWSDFNADGKTDVFITRGGHKGWMRRMPSPYWDELLVTGANGFKDIGHERGLEKTGCSGRQVGWVDYNVDGLLDLYVVCGRRSEYQSNQLFQQTAEGGFIDVATQAGLDIGPEGSFVWLDADSDGDPDLFYVDQQAFYLYKNKSGQFSKHHLAINPAGKPSKKLSVSDFDADGDLDVFAASNGGNALCVNMGVGFVVADPVLWGLPKKSITANWVDYDNDGFQDLHAYPNGLYRQHEPGSFRRLEKLVLSNSKLSAVRPIDARSSWVDINNDGSRDLILAQNFAIKKNRWAKWLAWLTGKDEKLGGLKNYWESSLFQNKNNVNHWLQVRLNGPTGNRAGIGARITVVTSDLKQTQQVGAAEGAHYSQGHYRLYFGLGKEAKPEAIVILWPDGSKQEIENPPGDQLMEINWQPGNRVKSKQGWGESRRVPDD